MKIKLDTGCSMGDIRKRTNLNTLLGVLALVLALVAILAPL